MWTTLAIIWVTFAIAIPAVLGVLSMLLHVWTRGELAMNLPKLWQDTKYGHFVKPDGEKEEDKTDYYMFTYVILDGLFALAGLLLLGGLMALMGTWTVLVIIALAPAIIFLPRAAVDVKMGRPLYTHPNTLLLENNTAEMEAMKAEIAELKAQREEK